jgi:sortase A
MALYRYVKSEPIVVRPRKRIRGLSFLLMTFGGAILVWVAWPILSFALTSDAVFAKIVAPIADNPQAQKKTESLSPVALAAAQPEALGAASNAVDFTNANAWYPTAPQKQISGKVNSYSLSIPKLKIENALVMIGEDDLNSSLIHYGGTGIPGDFGTAVIFGHSTLPQFFSPKSYKTIFSLLPTLDKGDEIYITYDGVSYKYEVYEMVVVEPTDLSALEQHFDDSYITLVTCVPPGTYWKRLNVHARLATL